MTDLRELAAYFKPPNWAVGGTLIATILLIMVSIYAFNKGENAAQSIQMISQAALVIAGLVGLPLAIWRSWTAHQQALTGQKQLAGFQKQIALLEAGAEADRLQKGAELLESDRVVVRIAGIAILRSIAIKAEHNFKTEAFRVLEFFARSISDGERENTKHIHLKNRKSPEDLAEAIQALLDTQENTGQQIGAMNLKSVTISNCTLNSFQNESLCFNSSTFRKIEVLKYSDHEFDSCEFFDCIIRFGEFESTEYKNCSFHSCDMHGRLNEDFAENKNILYGCNTDNLIDYDPQLSDEDIPF